MELVLTPVALRVLGVLIEKDLSTPEYYPLTLNALTNGCNQKSNRDPVMELSETIVQDGMDELIRHRLAGHASGAGSRAVKYRHAAAEHWQLGRQELAVLASLLLRGPQTTGEIKGRTGRMADFADLDEAADALHRLSEGDSPLCMALPVQPGKKEARYAHLLAGPIDLEALAAEEGPVTVPVSSMRLELDEMKARLEALEAEFAAFRRQFE
jgi:uncharacterized protein YceH (UPF0502 family)